MDKKRPSPTPNRLLEEKSLYLRQHAWNPVQWYPWGQEAFSKAKTEKKPIFLSIGYSACHWCHVMETESFEDIETARILNESFVSIKVDREERQDIDHVYMTAVQMLTHRGGWPLSVFLTPELKPFYGGTYFPKDDNHGMPSFRKVLTGVSQAWAQRRKDILDSAENLQQAILQLDPTPGNLPGGLSLEDQIASMVRNLSNQVDLHHGGMGSAPKFFHTQEFRLLLRQGVQKQQPELLQQVLTTLHALNAGGIQDQLAGGFHRYSTDAEWLVPHFEKMLYDNSLLTVLFLEAYQASQDPRWLTTVQRTLDYLKAEMEDPEGGFYSAQDADTEGQEGQFFAWSFAEFCETVPSDLRAFACAYFGVTEAGNWEGKNILHQKHSLAEVATAQGLTLSEAEDALNRVRVSLLRHRQKRTKPGTDRKCLASWNGYAICAFAKAAGLFPESGYLESAQRALLRFTTPLGQKQDLAHCLGEGRNDVPAFCDDYASLALGALALYEATWEEAWLRAARTLCYQLCDRFWEEPNLYFSQTSHATPVVRPKEIYDGATPSASGLAIAALWRTGRYLEDQKLQGIAEKALRHLLPIFERAPTASCTLGLVMEEMLSPKEWVFTFRPSPETLAATYLGGALQVYVAPGESHLLGQWREGKDLSQPKAYFCEDRVCQPALEGEAAVEKALRELRASHAAIFPEGEARG